MRARSLGSMISLAEDNELVVGEQRLVSCYERACGWVDVVILTTLGTLKVKSVYKDSVE